VTGGGRPYRASGYRGVLQAQGVVAVRCHAQGHPKAARIPWTLFAVTLECRHVQCRPQPRLWRCYSVPRSQRQHQGSRAVNTTNDKKYLELIERAIAVCLEYKPKFGKLGRSGVTLEEFQDVYGGDPFYSWFGLDSRLMYAAHKAAGGMTSVYRQIGIGCEWAFHAILQDQLGLSPEQAAWSYEVPASRGGGTRTLRLDGRIPLDAVKDVAARSRVEDWLNGAASLLRVDPALAASLRGTVFEVRQGYKSADSKRQNADIANAANAYANRYLPVNMVLSAQLSETVASRYVRAQWLLLRGTLSGTAMDSTYVFCRDVLHYDLAQFFKRNSNVLRMHVERILRRLLS